MSIKCLLFVICVRCLGIFLSFFIFFLYLLPLAVSTGLSYRYNNQTDIWGTALGKLMRLWSKVTLQYVFRAMRQHLLYISATLIKAVTVPAVLVPFIYNKLSHFWKYMV